MRLRSGLIAGIGLLGLAGCGDSAIVEQCMDRGGSARTCRCADDIMRAELTDEEYRLAEKIADGDDRAVERTMNEKGVGFAVAFAAKRAATALKIAQKCGGN